MNDVFVDVTCASNANLVVCCFQFWVLLKHGNGRATRLEKIVPRALREHSGRHLPSSRDASLSARQDPKHKTKLFTLEEHTDNWMKHEKSARQDAKALMHIRGVLQQMLMVSLRFAFMLHCFC